MLIRTIEELELHQAKLSLAAEDAYRWVSAHSGTSMEFLKSLKFEKIGFHPLSQEPHNLIEQINLTWTYAVAFAATRFLIEQHPDAGGFILAPGAIQAQELDIMSQTPGLVGAECFAATHHASNNKLRKDINKFQSRNEKYKYVFFRTKDHTRLLRHKNLENSGDVQVWSVEV